MTFYIKVPGSTANLGPGFDSIGLALNRYLELTCTLAKAWSFHYLSQGYENLPSDENNLIYQIYKKTAAHYGIQDPRPCCHVEITSDIPLERGLGSSAAAIVAGIELANHLLALNLTTEEKARLASLYEGHPDNASASVYGGLTIGTHSDEETLIIPCGTLPMDVVVMIPDQHLLTDESRNLLPKQLGFYQAVHASSLANVLVAALLRGDLYAISQVMAKDLFHHPYRLKAVPDLAHVTALLSRYTSCGVALSGAGPTIIIFTKEGEGEAVQKKLASHFPAYSVEILEPEITGSRVW